MAGMNDRLEGITNMEKKEKKKNEGKDEREGNGDKSASLDIESEREGGSSDDRSLGAVSVLEKRVYALELFLGSSSNAFDIEASQNQGPGSTKDNSGGAFPLIDSIAR